MSEKGQVLPDCPNASNPYHECTQSCLKKISHGQSSKDKKKSGNFFLSPVSVPLHLQLWQAFLDELNHLQSHFLSS
jgi:hypothetical protein